MDVLLSFYLEHAFWFWLAVGALLLAVEVGTGSGWLLWPAGAAAITAVLALFLPGNGAAQIGVFALLTIASTLAGRKFLARTAPDGPDINDTTTQIIGQSGEAVAAFDRGEGRVLVHGKEWAALLEGAETLPRGAKVAVTGVLSGAKLKVRPA